jgi:uncharacterized protein (DUF302 family)
MLDWFRLFIGNRSSCSVLFYVPIEMRSLVMTKGACDDGRVRNGRWWNRDASASRHRGSLDRGSDQNSCEVSFNEYSEQSMSYTIDRTFQNGNVDRIVERTRAALSDQGFGVLTEIDVKATLKKKLGVDIADYLILGACNPNMAYKAMQIEPRVGAMLPCNVIIRAVDDTIEVSAIDPVASMAAIDNDELKSVAAQVREMLKTVIAAI